MIRVVGVEMIGAISVLFLDAATPGTGWSRLLIDGATYAPIPLYDMEKAVAVIGSGFSAGQEVEFVNEH